MVWNFKPAGCSGCQLKPGAELNSVSPEKKEGLGKIAKFYDGGNRSHNGKMHIPRDFT
jgi:hypothetical protein